MNRETLRWYLIQLDWETPEACRRLGVRPDTMRHWINGDRAAPLWLAYPLLLELYYKALVKYSADDEYADTDKGLAHLNGYNAAQNQIISELRWRLDLAAEWLQPRRR